MKEEHKHRIPIDNLCKGYKRTICPECKRSVCAGCGSLDPDEPIPTETRVCCPTCKGEGTVPKLSIGIQGQRAYHLERRGLAEILSGENARHGSQMEDRQTVPGDPLRSGVGNQERG